MRRISARTHAHAYTHTCTYTQANTVTGYLADIVAFSHFGDSARRIRRYSTDTRAHVYTTADREFIFYGKLIEALGESFAAPRRSRSRYDKYLYRDRPLDSTRGGGGQGEEWHLGRRSVVRNGVEATCDRSRSYVCAITFHNT